MNFGWTAACLTGVGTLLPLPALAHAGHGAMAGAHWHPTDSFGVLLVAGAAALAWWLARGGK